MTDMTLRRYLTASEQPANLIFLLEDIASACRVIATLVREGAFAGNLGAAVVAVRRGGATHAYDTINHMFQMSRMILPGSTYWNMGFGLEKGDVLEDEEGLANMRHLGKSIDWLGRNIKASHDSYPKS